MWSDAEQAAGHGFAGVPFANTGVLYGLDGAAEGPHHAGQFVDLNAKVGGLDINADPATERIAGDPLAIANVYRSGLVNEANHLDEVAMINHGGPDPGIAHDYSPRVLDRGAAEADQGHTDNRVMWFGTDAAHRRPGWANEALFEMDRWLTAVEEDRRGLPLAEKIVADKPADVTDRCEVVGSRSPGTPGEPVCQLPGCRPGLARRARWPAARSPTTGSPAGSRPLDRGRLRRSCWSPFTDAEWATLQAVFPDGVCDWTQARRRAGSGRDVAALRHAAAGPSTAGATCPTCPPTPATAGRARPSASCCAASRHAVRRPPLG